MKHLTPDLHDQVSSVVPTSTAAKELNRQPQTLRKWAAYQTAELQPTRVHGRLLWPMDAIRKLLEGTA